MHSILHNVSVMFHCVARSRPLPPLPALPSQDGNELCNMMPCSRFPPGLPSSRLTLTPRTCFSRDTILSCLEFNVIRKQFGPHTASMVTWHGLNLPLAGLFLLCVGCTWRCLAAQGPWSLLARNQAWLDSGSVRCCLHEAFGITLEPQVSCAPHGLGHKQGRLSPLTPTA